MKPVKSGITRPPVCLFYGQHGLGKSTLASETPDPVFIQTEDGLQGLTVDTYGLVHSFSALHDQLDAALESKFKTVVIDTLDWAEKHIFKQCADDAGVTDIASIPFGRGYSAAEKYWWDIVGKLREINKTKLVVLLAHAQISRFESPETESYDRYTPDLHKKSAALLCEFADIVGFMSTKTITQTKDKGFGQTIVKAKSSGDRVLYLEERPAFTAKNRYRMPDQIEIPEGQAWAQISKHLKELKKEQGNLQKVIDDKVEKNIEKLSA